MADPNSANSSALLNGYLANMEANTRAGIAQNTGAAIPSANGNDVTVQASARPQPPVPTATAAPTLQSLLPTDPNIDMGTLQAPQSPSLNYDNSQSASAVNAANTTDQNQRNTSLYGVLPAGLRHGTLGSILGTLGDAFLTGSNRQPQYQPRMDRQAIGDAMAGMDMNDPASVQAAVQRVAATGAPEAADIADKIQTQAENMQMRKAQMDYNNLQRQQMNQIRFNGLYGNIGKAASGMLSTATAANYPQLYAALDDRIKHIDPNESAATALNIPMPQDFQEGSLSGYGMTGQNVQQSKDRAAQRGQSQTNAEIGATGRVQAATIGANSHTDSATIGADRPNEATFQDSYIAAKKAGQATTAEEDARFAHDTQISKGRGPGHPLIGTAPSNAASPTVRPANDGYPTFTLAQARAAAKVQGNSGRKFHIQGQDGLQVFH